MYCITLTITAAAATANPRAVVCGLLTVATATPTVVSARAPCACLEKLFQPSAVCVQHTSKKRRTAAGAAMHGPARVMLRA